MQNYSDYTKTVSACLNNAAATRDGATIPIDQAFAVLAEETDRVRGSKGCIYLAGNGASAAMASHTALDLWKNVRVKSSSFNDLVSLTAVSNDISYADVFAAPFAFFADKNDMLVCISSSGKSPNVIKAAEAARDAGCGVVTLSGMKPDNPLRKLGTLNFYVPGMTYGEAEIAHQALLHYWIDLMLDRQRK